MAKPKILIVTDDSGESFEILYAVHRFAEAGCQPVIAASKRKVLHAVLHDFDPDWNTYVEKPGYRIQAHLALRQVRPAQYAAVVLIGGRAPEFLRHDAHLIRIVQVMERAGRGIFAICHGVQILAAAGLMSGRTVTCYRNVRSEVIAAGARWVDRQSVVDRNWVTAQTWESHADFYRDIFRSLGRPQPQL